MEVKLVNINSVKPYENNPRINDAAVDAVAASLKEFGFRQPIVVDTDNVIIVGHTRLKAAIKLELKKVPVHVAKDLTPAQIKAYRIADHQTATLAEWNMDLLPIELKDLQGMDFNLDLPGFSANDLLAMLAPEGAAGLTDPDEVPAPPVAAITQPGDIWVLGNHRLMCGDSSKADDLDRLQAARLNAERAAAGPPDRTDPLHPAVGPAESTDRPAGEKIGRPSPAPIAHRAPAPRPDLAHADRHHPHPPADHHRAGRRLAELAVRPLA